MTSRTRSRLLAATCLLLTPQIAFAAKTGAGQALAQQYCAECHVIVPSGKAGWTDAPAFTTIANRQGTSAQTLSDFIQRPHMHMLNTGRPANEANDIAAYIISLRKS